ncbi:MAG: HAMP domain-containing histidine kinase [Planctomycetes bacterium]|nr:HAMP domain-containing histidine kinase [Planctomycetota bacterium]MBI3843758.1 HAMP domain-containing histidine kinase [Planctomycetota bacterium]
MTRGVRPSAARPVRPSGDTFGSDLARSFRAETSRTVAAGLTPFFVVALRRVAAALRGGVTATMPRRGTDDEVDDVADDLDRTVSTLEASASRQARFTADAAHELRNPISVIRNAAEVALLHDRSGAEYREFLADILVTSRRMGSIVDGLLLLARMDAGVVRSTFAAVDLVGIVRESAARLATDPERVRIANESVGVIRGEARLLRVLVDNLLSNALRYSEGKPVDVVVRSEASRRVTLSVRDFGPGVPPSEKNRVFERFYRGANERRDGSGAGLGLAIVDEIARVHFAECEIGDAAPGTRASVRFPASRSKTTEQSTEARRLLTRGTPSRARRAGKSFRSRAT